jgi:hypothetical protein
VQQELAVSNRQNRCVAECFRTWQQTEFHGQASELGRSHLSLPYIGAPLGAGRYHSNDTASSPAPRASASTKARRSLGSAARGRIAAGDRIALPSLSWNRPSNCLRAQRVTPPSVTQHTLRAHLAGKGRIAETRLDSRLQNTQYTIPTNDEGVDGLPCSWPRRPLWSSRTEPQPVQLDGPLRALVCAAATHARRARGL